MLEELHLSEGRRPSRMCTTPKFNENGDCRTTMKRQLLVAIVTALATVGVARADGTNTPAAAATTNAAAPKIQFDKTVYDFGTTSLVDSVTGTFTYQNVGAAELKLSVRTIEVRRAKVMKKMKAESLAELIRLTLAADPSYGKPQTPAGNPDEVV